MRELSFVSLFSGIESATVAFKALGFKPKAFAEIEPFCCALLAHHYPDVPNLGDVSKVDWLKFKEEHGAIDLVSSGFPCQAFSVAGARGGVVRPQRTAHIRASSMPS